MESLLLAIYLCGMLPSLPIIYKLSHLVSKQRGEVNKKIDRHFSTWAIFFWPTALPILLLFLIAGTQKKLRVEYNYQRTRFFDFLDKILKIKYD